jgi:hypothetical protein
MMARLCWAGSTRLCPPTPPHTPTIVEVEHRLPRVSCHLDGLLIRGLGVVSVIQAGQGHSQVHVAAHKQVTTSGSSERDI